ncbi:hypothetical protein [Comamonas sp. C11]|uniref:hypothetical protein n=1 Tax=Comamonas sp. C11 TaxID=2966554 RepID=UPI002112D1AC|nr:hypothetical protein [Comamonas sp. C11]UUC91424.1 hypothetical protein NOX35_13925 [Comamonas sp. C11]
MKLRPKPLMPVVDRLAWKLKWSCRNERNHPDYQSVLSIVKNEIATGNCKWAYLNGPKYCINFHILLNGESNALVQLVAVDPVRQKCGLRIDCNPAKLQPGDVATIHNVMRRIIGHREYNRLMREPLLQVFHVAVDILYLALSKVLVQYKNGQLMTVFGKRVSIKEGIVEGYNFGSTESNYSTAAYDKCQERVHAAVLEIAKKGNAGTNADPLTANKISQLKKAANGCDTTRVEVRGKKMLSLPLWKLPQQTNYFERFRFADLSAAGTELPPLIEKAFLAICRQDGVKAALATFKRTDYARSVPKYWRSRQATWWQPERLWEQACAALRESRIFPDSAFEPPHKRI